MKRITVHDDYFTTVPPNNVNNVSIKNDFIKKYEDVFSKELGTLPGQVHLQVDKTAQPVVTPPRRIPAALRGKFKGELNRFENLGVPSKVDERTTWVSSIVMTTKRSGQLTVCIDPRHLNRALKRETYQLPILNDLCFIQSSHVFSTVDLTAGY